MTADTCGKPPRPRKVAPPLKSTSTRFSSADECVATRPRTSVLSSSLLPEPVAPTQRPCGPLPPSADSLRSSVTGTPASSTPIGTCSRSAACRRRCAGSRSPTRSIDDRPDAPRPRPSSSGRPAAAAAPAACAGSGGPVAGEAAGQGRGLRDGEGVRAADGAQSSPCGPSRTGRPTPRAGARRPASAACPAARRCAAPSFRPRRPTSRALPPRRRPRAGAGRPLRRPGPDPPARPPTTAGRRRPAPSPSAPARRRRGSRGWPACGSHLTHSHSGARYGGATTASCASAGLCHSTYCATRARASARAGSGPAPGAASSQIAAGAAQRQRDRQVGDDRVRTQEAAQGERRDRLESLHRARLRGDQRRGQPLRAGARAQHAEVGIRAPALPQPPGGEHRRPGCGIGMHVLQRRPLLRGDDSHPAPRGRPGSAGSRAVPRRRRPAAGPRCGPRRRRAASRPSTARTCRRTATTTGRADPARRTRPSPAASPPGSNRARSAGGTGRSGSGGGSIVSSPPGRRGTVRGGRGTSTVRIAPPSRPVPVYLRLLRNGPAGTPARR